MRDRLLNDDKTVKSKSSEIFKSLGDEFGMSANAVQMIVCRNKAKIFEQNQCVTKSELKTNSENVGDNGDGEDDWNVFDLDGLTITVNLSDDEKKAFDFVEKLYNNKRYRGFKDGWSDVLVAIIASNNVPCILAFKRNNIIGYEFNATGTCKECKGTIKVESRSERAMLLIRIKYGPEQHTHTKFRRLTKSRVNAIREELEKSSVHQIYTAQAKNISMDAENLPRNFVTKKSIENVNTNKNASETPSVEALRLMKLDPSRDGAIKELTIDTFCVLFWTKEQQFYYSQIKNPCICVDATGGLITADSLLADIRKKLSVNVKLPHIFLHLISVKNQDGSSVPVGQMLSGMQDSVKISYFFNRWLLDFKMPTEIVMDDSAAYLKSSAQVFGNCSDTKVYITKCFDTLILQKPNFHETFIRLDSAHFIRNLHKNLNSKKMNHKAKKLYLSTIGFIMQCEDFDAACRAIEHMVALMNIPLNVVTKSSSSKISLETLKNLVTSHDIETLFTDDEKCFEEGGLIDGFEEDDYEEDTQQSFFDDILQKVMAGTNAKELAKKKVDEDIYYNPEMNPFFKKQFNRLPLWSAVMRKYSKTHNVLGISNDLESRFNVIKNVVFDKLPTKPEIFIEGMLDEVNALAKLTALEIKHKQNCIKYVRHNFLYNLLNLQTEH